MLKRKFFTIAHAIAAPTGIALIAGACVTAREFVSATNSTSQVNLLVSSIICIFSFALFFTYITKTLRGFKQNLIARYGTFLAKQGKDSKNVSVIFQSKFNSCLLIDNSSQVVVFFDETKNDPIVINFKEIVEFGVQAGKADNYIKLLTKHAELPVIKFSIKKRDLDLSESYLAAAL
jgi:hypothetical protein